MRRWMLFAFLLVVGCDEESTEPPPLYDFELPAGFPVPFVPPDNPMTAEKVSLGRTLFFDTRLSGTGEMSCASCHEVQKSFTDGKITPTGSTGQLVPRNSPSLANVAYYATFTWFNPTLTTLEDQAVVPLFGENPVEMGVTGNEEAILARFRDDPATADAFAAAFPDEDDSVSFGNVAKAIASFERTLISGSSAYDRFQAGDTAAMSDAALRGFDLFFSERFECYHCHSGVNFTTSFRSALTQHAELDFHNTGLYNVGGTGAYPGDSPGLSEFSGSAADQGKMRVPSLRNVTLTAPYMHDGSIATLEEVIDMYAAGGRDVTEGPYAGDGRASPNKSPLVRGFPITPEERADVIAFLESLTDVVSLEARAAAPP
jgi:cytochrome c peroxidase